MLEAATAINEKTRRIDRALDFGCGDGFYAYHLMQCGRLEDVVPVDVVRRQQQWVEPMIYDGHRLPFDDGSFDLAYAVDVVHHCPDPLRALSEITRCSRRFVLLKDHNCDGLLGHLGLTLMDWSGNVRFGIPSPGHYQRKWNWLPWFSDHGWVIRYWLNPAPSHAGLMGKLTNQLQFVGLWERVQPLPPGAKP